MNEKTNKNDNDPIMDDETPPPGLNSVIRLFLIPLGIVIVSMSLFYLFGLFTFETKSLDDYLQEIKTGGESKKWQSAYSLAGLLVTEETVSEDTRDSLTREILALFKNKQRYNTKVRSYLALSLGYLKQEESVPVLIEAIKESDEDIVLYSIWALSVLGYPEAQAPLIPYLKDRRPAIRKISAFALGAFPGKKAIPALKQVLNDSVADVGWNAALSLSQLGDDSGTFVLMRLLDREYLSAFPNLSDKERETVIINAIRGLARVKHGPAGEVIQELSKNDPSLKVRQMALEAIPLLS